MGESEGWKKGSLKLEEFLVSAGSAWLIWEGFKLNKRGLPLEVILRQAHYLTVKQSKNSILELPAFAGLKLWYRDAVLWK